MDAYLFLTSVTDWNKLYDLQRAGTIRSIAKIAIGPYSAMISYPATSPSEVLDVRDVVCPSGLLNCVGGLGQNPLGPCRIHPADFVFIVEGRVDRLVWEDVISSSRGDLPDAHTRLSGHEFNLLAEFTGSDYTEVEGRVHGFLSHPGIQSYRLAVTGADLIVGAGPE